MWSLSKYVGDGKLKEKSIKKGIGLMTKQQFFTCIMLFWTFLRRYCTTSTRNFPLWLPWLQRFVLKIPKINKPSLKKWHLEPRALWRIIEHVSTRGQIFLLPSIDIILWPALRRCLGQARLYTQLYINSVQERETKQTSKFLVEKKERALAPTTATAAKTSLEKRIRAVSSFITLILSR